MREARGRPLGYKVFGEGPMDLVNTGLVSSISFADRGARTLRGIPDEWRLYAVESV